MKKNSKEQNNIVDEKVLAETIKNLLSKLNSKKIRPMEFAEQFPIVVDDHPKEEVIHEAMARYRNTVSPSEFEKFQNDPKWILEIIQDLVLKRISTLMEGYTPLIKMEGGEFPAALLVLRTIEKASEVYPWAFSNE